MQTSDGSPYEKRVDAKGRVLSDECIADQVPFEELPEGWAWVRLEEIGDWKAGATPAKSRPEYYANGTIPWLLTGDLNDGIIDEIPSNITEQALKECSVRLNPAGSVLIAMYGATIGKIGVLGIPATTNQACCACILHDEAIRGWLATWLLSYKPRFVKLGMGGAQPNISRGAIISRILPVPPLAEQHRIVERVNKLMPLVEEYGSLEDAREELDADLPSRLRKSVLQMAVQGKLVPQDTSDEPASSLLERIREQRRKLIVEKKIKPPKGGESVIYTGSDGRRYEKRVDAKGRESEPICIEDEIPFEIPESWEWTRLESVIVLLSGTDLKPSQYNEKNEGIPYLTGASNFTNGELIENRWTIEPSRISNKGELLFTCKGTVGEMAINQFDAAHIARQIMSITPCEYEMLPYIALSLKAMVEDIKSHAKGVIPGIERNTLLARLIPIPPLAEQKRIAGKSAELFGKIA